MSTFAEGVATQSGYELPQRIMREMLDDFFLVSDDDIRRAIGLPGGKGAYPGGTGRRHRRSGGAVKHAEQLKGKKVSITVTGANITADRLAESLEVYREGSA